MGTYPIGIVGESFDNDDGSSRQDEIARCGPCEAVSLVREPDNRFDPNCVKVISARGIQIGNISRDDDWICERIARGGFVDARILNISTGKLAKGVVLCVRTTEGDDWLSDTDSTAGVDPPNTGCFIVIALIAVPALLLLSGCDVRDNRPDQWDAFVYLNAGSDRVETIRGFKSFELCQEASIDRLRQMPDPDKGTYECGYKCRYDAGLRLEVCKETRARHV